MKKLNGSSSLEMIMIMILLILFTSSTYTMIYAGLTAQDHILDQKQTQINTRVAISYLNVKFKQNDVLNKVSVEENPINGKNAIILHDTFNDSTYDTWIYLENGSLVEQLVETGKAPESDLGFEIAVVDDFNVEMENNCIKTTISYMINHREMNIDSIYTFKSNQN